MVQLLLELRASKEEFMNTVTVDPFNPERYLSNGYDINRGIYALIRDYEHPWNGMK